MGGYTYLIDNFAVKGEPNDPNFIAIECDSSNTTCISCSRINPYYKDMFRPINDQYLPWTGLVFGLTINSVWYWCSDQVC